MQVNPRTGQAIIIETKRELLEAMEKQPDHPVFATGEEIDLKGCRFRIVQVCRDRRLILKPVRATKSRIVTK